MNRKLHNWDKGYIAERMNPYVPGSKVVIYVATEQGIDVPDKYAVVCDAHATIGTSRSVPDARLLMKYPDNFCEACDALAREQEAAR